MSVVIEKRPMLDVRMHLQQHAECADLQGCRDLASEMLDLFASGRYEYPASLLQLVTMDSYLDSHRTARKRAQRSRKLGYRTDWLERSEHRQEIYEINTSLPRRQGRPMSRGYLDFPDFSPLPDYACPRHWIDCYGVWREKLVAYIVLYVSGDMAMISQILGHGDYLKDDIMYLLVTESFGRLPLPVTVFYNRHDGGEAGLRYFKERLGFEPGRARWVA